jgi:hypothetical protein
MMDCVSRKNVYSMAENDVDDVVYMKSIHMKTKEDGKMLIKRLVKGAYELLQNIS